MKRIAILVFAWVSTAAASEYATLDEVLDRLAAVSPELRAAQARARAAEARVGPAGTWPDPVLGYAREKRPDGERMRKLAVRQEVPFPGKPTREAKAVQADADRAEARVLAAALALRREARSLYASLTQNRRIARSLTEEIQLIDALMASARGRLASDRSSLDGPSPAQELFSLEAERGRLVNRSLTVGQEERRSLYRLNVLLDRDPESAISAETPLPSPMPGETAPALARRALERGPAYAEALAEARRARAGRAAARLAWAPDFGFMYEDQRREDGARGYEAAIALSIPLWLRRPTGLGEEGREELAGSGETVKAVGRQVAAAVYAEHAEVATSAAQVRRYETAILPAARSALGLARRRYESGRGGFVPLLDALRRLIEAEVEEAEARARHAAHWGMLEEAVGETLPEERRAR